MIYIVRHGQTDWNVLGKCQGWQDIELNQTGKQQAAELAQKLAAVKFDVCFSSPLKRALATARHIYHGEIITDPRLIERGMGQLEGQTKVKELIKQKAICFDNADDNSYGIEIISKVKERLRSFWDEVLTKYAGKNVLVVTHGGTARWSLVYFYGMPESHDLTPYRLQNCEFREIDNRQPQKTWF